MADLLDPLAALADDGAGQLREKQESGIGREGLEGSSRAGLHLLGWSLAW